MEFEERNLEPYDVYNADEAFVTGTFAGIIPVIKIDQKELSNGKRGKITHVLQKRYRELIDG